VAVYSRVPPIGKPLKGVGAAHGFFKHTCDHVAMILHLFKKL
jgi:hypothetical protein